MKTPWQVGEVTARMEAYLMGPRRAQVPVRWFIRGLAVFAALKGLSVLLNAPLFFSAYVPPSPSRVVTTILFAPLLAFGPGVEGFLIAFCLICCAVALSRPSVSTTALFFWLLLNFMWLKRDLYNGSDLVLVLFAGFAVLLSGSPFASGSRAAIASDAVSNATLFVARYQVLLIYVISGLDKVTNPLWTSGNAFAYISRLELMFHPAFGWMRELPAAHVALAWMTIAFELTFPVLVMIRRTRKVALAAGIVFHIVIWTMLSLPDFAVMMMLTYLLFLRDEDAAGIRRLLRR